jgi:hypothetical protein
MSSEEQTREEFMTACMADGTAEEVCAARWKAAHEVSPTPSQPKQSPGDVALLKEVEMLKARVALREKQLKQAIDIANRANDKRKAEQEAEKQSLILSIQSDSKFSKDELEEKTLEDLQTMRLTLDRSIEKTFANVAAEIDAANRKQEPYLTAGYFDPATKTWKGGVN